MERFYWLRSKEIYQKIQKTYWMHVAQSNPNKRKKKEAMNNLLQEVAKFYNIAHCKNIPCNVMTAIVYLNVGILHIEMKDTEFAIECYKECIDLLKDNKLTSEGILPAISVNNQLGLIYAQQDVYEDAKDFFKQAEDLYIKFTKNVKSDPILLIAIIGIKEIEGDHCAKTILEKFHISTLYSLAQIYRNLDDTYGFALDTHKVQSKQLDQNKIIQEKIMQNYLNWALNARSICHHFIIQDKFPQARHHLAVTSYLLKKYLKISKEIGTKETNENIVAESRKLDYDKTSASVAKCWIRYGVALLKSSKERLMKKTEQEDQDSQLAEAFNEIYKYFQTETMEDLRFVDLEPELESIANEITDKYLLDFNSARSVFLNVQKWLNKAKEYYTFENHVSNYVWIAQNFSQAYRYLAFFEDNKGRQARMHKRRIDILEEVIKRLCPQDYQIVCRKIWIELAETYLKIMDLKIERLQASKEKLTAHVTKIERLAKSSIKHYQSFLNSLEMTKSESGIESFSDDILNEALYIYYRMGLIYSKIITFDLQQRIDYLQSSVDAYRFIVNYCDKHPEKQEELKKYEWVKLSEEFLTWLPNSLESLKEQMDYPGQHGTSYFYNPFS